MARTDDILAKYGVTRGGAAETPAASVSSRGGAEPKTRSARADEILEKYGVSREQRDAGVRESYAKRSALSDYADEFLPDSGADFVRRMGYNAERAAAAALGAGEAVTDFLGTTLYTGVEKVASLGGLAPNALSEWSGKAADKFLDNSISEQYKQNIKERYNPSVGEEKWGNLTEAGAQMATAIATGKAAASAVGKASSGVTALLDKADDAARAAKYSKGAFGLQAAGGATNEAHDEGATRGQALTYGAAVGAMETAIESIAGGIPGMGKGKIGEIARKVVGNPTVGKILDTLGEGGEEALSTIVTPFIKRAIYNENAAAATADEIAESAIMGILLSGIAQGGAAVAGRVAGTAQEAPPNAAAQRTGQSEGVDMAESESPAQAAARASAQAVPSRAQDALVESIVRSLQPVTNKQAEAIWADADSVAQLGIDTNGMTRSQQRAAVKDRVAQLQLEMPAEQAYRRPDPLVEIMAGENSTQATVENQKSFDGSGQPAYTGIEQAENLHSIADRYSVVLDNNGKGRNKLGRRSEQAQSVIERAARGEEISIEELNAIPEVAMALEEVYNGVETYTLPNRENVVPDGVRLALERGSYSGKGPDGKDIFNGAVRRNRRIDIVTGVAGSGKSSVYSNRISRERGSRIIDTDDYRDYIPEYNGRNAALVHEEASAIKKGVLAQALTDGENILLSVVGDNAEKLAREILSFKRAGYEVHLHLNHLDNRKSIGRVVARYVDEKGVIGRLVAPEIVKKMGDGPMQAYLLITGQGGAEHADTGGKQTGSTEDQRDRAAGGEGLSGVAGGLLQQAGAALTSYDAHDNDVARGEPARFLADISRPEVKSEPAGSTVGAAASGSVNTPYHNLQQDSSQFHDEGANAARPVDVPMYDAEGNPISRFASNMMGAKALPDDVIPMIQQMVADGELSYRRRGNKTTRTKARAAIREKGFDGAMEQLRTAIREGRSDVDTVALGTELLVNAANAGDANAVAEIASLMQTTSTNVGQAMQYFTVLRKLNPESQLYAIRKTVEQLNERVSPGLEDLQGIEIPQELVEKFMAQTDQEGRDGVMEEIYQAVANQVPATWKDKWDAWRYMAMLTNPRTHIRNIVGNLGFQPVRVVKNKIAAALERVLGVEEKTKAFAVSPVMYRAAWADFDKAGKLLNGNRYTGVQSEIERRRPIFKNRVLEGARKGNSAALDFEDAVFKRITYADALAGYLTANGVKAEQLDGGTVDQALLARARDYAAAEALKATYQDDSAAARKVDQLARAMGPAGDALLPFKKTPANILARGFEYSPAGLAKALTVDLAKVQSGEKSVAEALDAVAAGLTGTGLFSLGAYLFAQGLVTGAQGDDEEDKWADLLGHQGYALELPDGTSVTLDWLAPEALPFFMGVEFMSSVGEAGWTADEIISASIEATKAAANPMMELSMLQGVNDLIESVRYAEGAPLAAMIPSTVTSYLSQAVPTVLGQAERSTEEVRMTTYTDKNSEIPKDLQYAIGRASARIPGIDFNQIPYIDAWGRDEDSGDTLVRTLNNTLNPAYTSKVEMDAVEAELQRLHEATGESVFPDRAERYITVDGQRKDLTAQEYVKYAKALGQASYDLIRAGQQTAEYRAMSDSEKAGYIQDIYKYAGSSARAQTGGNPMEGWMLHAKNAKKELGISTAEYIAARQKYDGVVDGSGYDTTRRMVDAGLTLDQWADMKGRVDADGNGSVKKAEVTDYIEANFPKEFWSGIFNAYKGNRNWKNPY